MYSYINYVSTLHLTIQWSIQDFKDGQFSFSIGYIQDECSYVKPQSRLRLEFLN